MKIIYFLIMLLTLTACGSSNNEDNNANEVSNVGGNSNSNTSTTENTPISENTDTDENSNIGENNTVAEEIDAVEEEPVESIVYIETGAIQCEADGVSQLETAQLLSNNGITVIDSQCGNLTTLVAAQCGLPNTEINLHTLPTESLAGALALGFKSADAIKQDDDPGYTVKECKLPPT